MVAPADSFAALNSKMGAAGLDLVARATFQDYWHQLARGVTGYIDEDELVPVGELPSIDSLGECSADSSVLDQVVVIKLNGGLGTSMGMTKAKSLLVVKERMSFLDIIALQILDLRRRTGARIPLVLMDSQMTSNDSLTALHSYPDLASTVPFDFCQHMVPKLRVEDLGPVEWPADPRLEWCPPGHGDLYPALASSGMLDVLLGQGYRYAFVSNSDNLGAVLSFPVLGWIAAHEVPFVMEVAHRTEADRKGGHLARLRDGRLVLRELAQCPQADMDAFGDVRKHCYFNTNNIWLDLRRVRDMFAGNEGILPLPMIRNEKHVDPTDPSSPAVYQLETAMGAAISVFGGAQALRVGRDRFAPVKTTNDLLAVRSDVYELTADWRVAMSVERTLGARSETWDTPVPERALGVPFVDLDPDNYRLLSDFEARFPNGVPSLRACRSLRVRGDVTFGADVVVLGDVQVDASGSAVIPDGAQLEGRVELCPKSGCER